MSFISNFDSHKIPVYFSYRHTSTVKDHFRGTFHAHQGVEILLIHEGRGRLIFDQKSYEIQPGLICVFQPYQLHHIQMEIDEEHPYVRSVAQYEPALYESYFEKWPGLRAFYRLTHKGNLPMPICYGKPDTEMLGDIFQSFHEAIPYLRKDQYAEEFSLFLVALFRKLQQLWRNLRIDSSMERRLRMPHPVERILEWLETGYKEPLRLEQMSKELHLSAHHLSHLFKECTGSSLTEYVAAKRMQQAVLLLLSSSHSVAQIGEEVGISNCSHFCKTFKKHFGLTPYQYRKKWPRNAGGVGMG